MENALWQVDLSEDFIQTTPLFLQLKQTLQKLDDQQIEAVLADIMRLTIPPNALNINETKLKFSTVDQALVQKKWNEVVETEIKDPDFKQIVLHATNQNLLIQFPINIIKELSGQQFLSLNPSGTMIDPCCKLKIKTSTAQALEYHLTYTCKDKTGKKLYQCTGTISITKTQQIDTPYQIKLSAINFIAYSPKVKHFCPTLYNRYFLNKELEKIVTNSNSNDFNEEVKRLIYSVSEKIIDYSSCYDFKVYVKNIISNINKKLEKTQNHTILLQLAEKIAKKSLQKAIKNILVTINEPNVTFNERLRDDYVEELFYLKENNFAVALQMLDAKHFNCSIQNFYRLMTGSFFNYKQDCKTSYKEAGSSIARYAKVLHKQYVEKHNFLIQLYRSLTEDELKLLKNHINNYVANIALDKPINIDDLNEKIIKRLLLKTIITKELSALYAPTPENVFNKYLDIIEKFLDIKIISKTSEIKKHIKELPAIIYKITKANIENASETIIKDIENDIRFQNINRLINRDLNDFSAKPDQKKDAWPPLYYQFILPLLHKIRNGDLSTSFLAACEGEIKDSLNEYQIRNWITKNTLIKFDFRSSQLFEQLYNKHDNELKRKHFMTNCSRGFRIPWLQSKRIIFKPSEEQRKTLAKIAALREIHYQHCQVLFGDNHDKTRSAKRHFEESKADGINTFFANLNLRNKSIEKIFNQYLLHQERFVILMQEDLRVEHAFENEKKFFSNQMLKIINHYRYSNEKTEFFDRSFKKIVSIFDKNILFTDFNEDWYKNLLTECKNLLAGSHDVTQQLANLNSLKLQAEDFIAQQSIFSQFVLNSKLNKLKVFIEEVKQYAITNEVKLVKYRLNQLQDPIDNWQLNPHDVGPIPSRRSELLRDLSTDTILKIVVGGAHKKQISARNQQIQNSQNNLEQKKLRLQKLIQQHKHVYGEDNLPTQFSLFAEINNKESLRETTHELASDIVTRRLLKL